MKPALMITLLLVASIALAEDAITLKSGTTVTAEVLEYKDGILTIRRADGKVTRGKMSDVQRIKFGEEEAKTARPPQPVERGKENEKEKEPLQQYGEKAWLLLPVSKRYTIKPEKSDDGISLRYEDYPCLAQEQKDKARNERLSSERLNLILSLLPKGGYLVVNINENTIEDANTKNFLAIVTDLQGKEIVRKLGPDDIADSPATPGGSWSNLFIFRIPEEIKTGVEIRIVDRLDNEASDFTLRSTKKSKEQ